MMEVTEGGNGGRSLGCSTCRFLLSSLLDGFVEGLEAPRGWVRGYTETGELSVMASGPIARFQGLTPFFLTPFFPEAPRGWVRGYTDSGIAVIVVALQPR